MQNTKLLKLPDNNAIQSAAGTTIRRLLRAVHLIAMAIGVLLAPVVGNAQSAGDFTVEVVVADQGASQRSSGYWLALDRVLRRNMPEGSVDETTRAELLKDATRYVQAYRYRKFDPATDGSRLATRKVREGSAADSVIVVTFPASLPAIIARQSQPVELVEESLVQESGRILALIAVEQDGQQFLIGGERGKKFQSRLLQLGAANNLIFEFPILDDDDRSIISPSNVLYSETDQLDLIARKYNSSSRLTGALVRLSADAWQSGWNLQQPGLQAKTANLTTRSLDEALTSAITQLANSGNQGLAGSSYLSDGSGFTRDGVALRIENISSLGQYEQVLNLLRKIDPEIFTEALEPGAIIFRASSLDAYSLQQSLARQPGFSQLDDSTQVQSSDAMAELSYYYQSR